VSLTAPEQEKTLWSATEPFRPIPIPFSIPVQDMREGSYALKMSISEKDAKDYILGNGQHFTRSAAPLTDTARRVFNAQSAEQFYNLTASVNGNGGIKQMAKKLFGSGQGSRLEQLNQKYSQMLKGFIGKEITEQEEDLDFINLQISLGENTDLYSSPWTSGLVAYIHWDNCLADVQG